MAKSASFSFFQQTCSFCFFMVIFFSFFLYCKIVKTSKIYRKTAKMELFFNF